MSSHLAFLRTHQVQKLETAIEAFDLLQFDLDGTGTRHKSFKVISHTSFGISSNLFQSCKSLHTVSALVEYSPRAHYANQCQGASGKDGSKGKAVSGGTCNVNFSVDDTIRYKGSKIKNLDVRPLVSSPTKADQAVPVHAPWLRKRTSENAKWKRSDHVEVKAPHT